MPVLRLSSEKRSSRSMQPASVLILPGLGNSGPNHWQTHWQTEHGYRRVEQANWDRPGLKDWLANLHAAVSTAESGVVLVAHSLACSLVAHYAKSIPERVLGAFLVSPADVESARRTKRAASRPFRSLPCPSPPTWWPALTIPTSTWPAPNSSPRAGALASLISVTAVISTPVLASAPGPRVTRNFELVWRSGRSPNQSCEPARCRSAA